MLCGSFCHILDVGDDMQRYFICSDKLVDDQAVITGADVHHIMDVMRKSVGDQLTLCTCDKRSYLVEIITLDKLKVIVKVVKRKKEDVELPVLVTISQGITKKDKFEWVLQKATECGAYAFIPVAMKRSVANIDAGNAEKKVKRWQKITLEAARQSHRQLVPNVKRPLDLKDLIAHSGEYDMCLFAYEAHGDGSKSALADAIARFKPEMRVLVLIGPEGGLDEVEVEMLIKAGFRAVGLGPRILRTETAPIYIMSAISYAMELCK